MENTEKLSKQIYEKKFPEAKASMFGGGNAGFEKTRVNLYLEELAEEVEKLEKKIEILELRNTSLEEEIQVRAVALNQEEEEVEEKEEAQTEEFILDEQSKKRMRQLETLERAYKRMILMAEQEAEEIRSEAKEQARKMLIETQTKSDMLLKEVNARYEDKEEQIKELEEVKGETEKQLLTIAEYIMSSTGQKKLSS